LPVIPAKAGAEGDRRSIHERGRRRISSIRVHGCRIKSGMTVSQAWRIGNGRAINGGGAQFFDSGTGV
jgi:hypothetical protein